MGRNRKYNTEMEIEEAFRPPDGEESEVDQRRRLSSRTSVLYRLRKRQRDTVDTLRDTAPNIRLTNVDSDN
ncbi:hypothetical protein JG688_00017484 [Phytophthora aleatoria]|uniref:Uncharacterized protein n=1 Tax=Phytophthora aleatoria TaxID=2496075 RepID=A0A8J5M1A6_9STRA|nr:hypothetical protein GQ600_20094 [Phytophthora cactorum]KAG6943685.1 hypothetical protein JG688_00017484 [Phytophthora aleatoria]